ncbi:MAG: hypothetical protein MUF19_02545 [Candidatus Pacebacteria bacterium]|jgi:hypothetical protein|nr:hypothetical protein [Candidatus Paceibacterota bacterium]
MSQFQFDEEQRSVSRNTAGGTTGLSRKLIAWGVVRNQNQANVLLLVVVAICFAIITINLLSLTKTPTPAQLISEPATN